ncbi:transposase [Microcoleus sp. bin38.metabat.b11b12b14.051]|uniref:transposase n=1 Tax=Microcoleus sp. bin38.metabat.b11b12b14.051 TaxID=2742709 RepID=UPI00345AFD97
MQFQAKPGRVIGCLCLLNSCKITLKTLLLDVFYSTNLTDALGEILSPFLYQILPQKKRTRPPNWTQRQILNGILYQLKNGCNWADIPKKLPPYSTVYWYYKQWRSQGAIGKLMRVLHSQLRAQVKKNRNGLH